MSVPRLLVLAILLSPTLAATAAVPVGSTAEPANQPGTLGGPASTLRAQALLDRARFGPGEIDGQAGSNLRRALNGFQDARGLSVSGKLDVATSSAPNADAAPALVAHTFAAEDVAGSYVAKPGDIMAKSELESPKPHYGTPVPRTIGKTRSHGWVRLSNRDVLAVATAVDASVPVVMQERAS